VGFVCKAAAAGCWLLVVWQRWQRCKARKQQQRVFDVGRRLETGKSPLWYHVKCRVSQKWCPRPGLGCVFI
jgi:hypothetical protein